MENCAYCEKTFTKRGMTNHTNKCKSNPTNVLRSCENVIKSLDIVVLGSQLPNKKTSIDLPFDCIKLIKEYFLYKDKFTSYRKHYRDTFWVALVSKSFYDVFRIPECEISLCKELVDNERSARVCKTDAKKEYGLIDKDFDILEYCEKRHNTHKVVMRLYLKLDVLALATKKHGSYDNYISQKMKKETETKKRRTMMIIEQNNRRTLLETRLQEHRLRLREDSVLCSDFIHSNIGNIDNIVVTMLEMDFYFKYTPYPDESSKERDNYFYTDHNGRTIYRTLTENERREISITAKRKALNKWCARYFSFEAAIERKHLPHSLIPSVKKYFDNKASRLPQHDRPLENTMRVSIT